MFRFANPNEESRSFFTKMTDRTKLPAGKAFWKGLESGADGSLLGLPLIAMEVGTAQRGEQLPTLIGRGAGLLTYPALSGAMAFGGSMIADALGVAVPGIGFVASMAAMYPDGLLQDAIIRKIKIVTDAGVQLRRLEFGGNYQDTQTAQNMRISALQQMNGAVGASRRYLGQEAALMHR